MISYYRPTRSGWALIIVGVVALALGGCGRKGPLDRPPSAAQSSTANVPNGAGAERPPHPSAFNPTAGTETDPAPVAGKGRKRPFVLDPVLD